MINPSEFRKGNYFQWMDIASMGQGADTITEKNHYQYEQLREPVPLNERWLKEFGFKEAGNGWFSINKDFLIIGEYKKGRWREINVLFDHLEYVHQLQNLYFSLTGKELTRTTDK